MQVLQEEISSGKLLQIQSKEVWKQKKQSDNLIEDTVGDKGERTLFSLGSKQPGNISILIYVQLNRKDTKMQVDTGASDGQHLEQDHVHGLCGTNQQG